jgi:hypothetical protein
MDFNQDISIVLPDSLLSFWEMIMMEAGDHLLSKHMKMKGMGAGVKLMSPIPASYPLRLRSEAVQPTTSGVCFLCDRGCCRSLSKHWALHPLSLQTAIVA